MRYTNTVTSPQNEPDDERSDTLGAARGSDDEAQVWALTPGRRALHWILVAALVSVTVAVVVTVVQQRPTGVALFGAACGLGFGCFTLYFVVQQARAGVAVWLDATDQSLTVFRAAGGALRTYPSQVRRIDRGHIDGRRFSPTSSYPPLRIITADGTVTLSPLLGPASDIADAIAARNPEVQINL